MLSTMGLHDSSLLTKSPKPGVSTTVRRRRTPASSMSALIDWIETVLGIMSRLGPFRSLGGYREVLKRVLTSVDLPRPDSPKDMLVQPQQGNSARGGKHTDDHNIKVEPLTDALAVPLVGKVGESNITSQFPTDNVLVVVGGSRGRSKARGRGYGHQVRRRDLWCWYVEPLLATVKRRQTLCQRTV